MRIGSPGAAGESAYGISSGGRGTSPARQKRITDEPVQEGQPRRLTRPAKIGPAGSDNETYVIGQNILELAKGR
jgi:hypothetical protein